MRLLRLQQRGFTIPELLVAIIFFVALGGLTLFLLQTKPKDIEMHNAQRELDTALLVQTLATYYDENQALPEGITTSFKEISSEEKAVDLCSTLVPGYITDLPFDPTAGMVTKDGGCAAEDQQYRTGYSIKRDSVSTEITVVAVTSEGGKVISLTKKLK